MPGLISNRRRRSALSASLAWGAEIVDQMRQLAGNYSPSNRVLSARHAVSTYVFPV
jgi:hypothetical protein